MAQEFDPLQEWLGIPIHEQPPHYYRLLGLALFEANPQAIEAGAERQAAAVRAQQGGPQGALAQTLLGRLQKVRGVLLDPAKKAVYDEQLRARGIGAAPAASAAEPPRSRQTAAPHAQRRKRSWLVASIAGAGVVLALAALVVVWLTRGAGKDSVAAGPSENGDAAAEEAAGESAPEDGAAQPEEEATPAPAASLVIERGPPADAVQFQGHSYLFPDEVMPLVDALQVAVERDARLVTIRSAEENDFVARHVHGPTCIGLVKLEGAGWLDSAGAPPSYANWGANVRDNARQDFIAVIGKDGRWSTEPVTAKPVRVAFEWGPEKPAADATLAAGANPGLRTRDSWRPADGNTSFLKRGAAWTFATFQRNDPLQETGRPDDYVELLDTQRDVQWRLAPLCAAFKNRVSERWTVAYVGGWRATRGEAIGGTLPSLEPNLPLDGYALRFQGRDCVELQKTKGLADIGQEFTVELWFRPEFGGGEKSPPQQWLGMWATAQTAPELKTGVGGWCLRIEAEAINPVTRKVTYFLHYANQEGAFNHLSYHQQESTNEAWKHLAICGEAGDSGWTVQLFLDGRSVVKGVPSPKGKDQTVRPSPVNLFLGTAPFHPANERLAGLIRAFRLSSKVRYGNDFVPPLTLEKDDSTVALLDFTKTPTDVIPDVTEQGHDGRLNGVKWVALRDDKTVVAQASPQPSPGGTPSTPGSEGKPDATLVVRADVPPAEDRDKALASVKIELKDQIERAKTAAEKLELSKLMIEGAQSAKELATTFAMLSQARDLAAEAGDVDASFRAVAEMERRFAVDPIEVKAEAIKVLVTTADARSRRNLAQMALDYGNQSATADKFDLAQTYLATAVSAATKLRDVELQKLSRARSKEIDEAKKGWSKAEEARQKLAANPDDTEAHGIVGRYLCFQKGDWATGLPHLAKGSDALAKHAAHDLKEPTDDKERVELGDAWFTWGEQAKGGDQNGAWLRAQHWYALAEPRLGAAQRIRVKKRLDDLATRVVAIEKAAVRGAVRLPWLEAAVGEVRVLSGHNDRIGRLSISRSGRVAATIDQTGVILAWDLSAGRQLQKIRTDGGRHATVAITPDERHVAANAGPDSLGLWNAQTGAQVFTRPIGRAATDMAFSEDGKLLACTSHASTRGAPNIGLWDMSGSRPPVALKSAGTPGPISFSPDGRLLATGETAGDFATELWSPPRIQPTQRLTGHSTAVADVAFSPDSRLVASASGSQVIIWNVHSGEKLQTIKVTETHPTVDFTADGRRVVTAAGATGAIQVWSVADGALVQKLEPAPDPAAAVTKPVTRIRCLPDPRGAVSGHVDGSVRIWRLPD